MQESEHGIGLLGRTRSDLANILQITGNNLFGTTCLFRVGGLIGVTGFLAGLGLSIAYYWNNNDIEKREIKALEKGCKDMEAENRKERYKSVTPQNVALGCAFIAADLHKQQDEHILSIMGYGSLINSAGLYVMRADYLPPGKNCLSRGLDKFKAWYTEQQTAPEGIPAPAMASRLACKGGLCQVL